MRRRYVLVGFALLIALAAALPALGAPSPLSFAKAAVERAQKADRTAHKAMPSRLLSGCRRVRLIRGSVRSSK